MPGSFSALEVFGNPFAMYVSYSTENQTQLVFASRVLHVRHSLVPLSFIARNTQSVMVLL